MNQYYVLTLHPRAGEVIRWILDRKLDRDVHLNRTRFWVPDGPILTEFHLRFGDCCPWVDPRLDPATGLPK